jgi:signal transduction histidine kinase
VLATIRKRAQGLQRRVEDLLRVARSESGQLELDFRPVSLLDVVSEAVDTLGPQAARRGISLELEPGPTDAEVMADPEWLRQIVEGLIDNALRHGGSLTRIVVRLGEAEGGARIAVEDDGRGFPEDRERLFERFGRGTERADGLRAEGPGFGIGLALARWVVERHNGSIAIDGPEEGRRGGRVTVTLPADRKEDAA